MAYITSIQIMFEKSLVASNNHFLAEISGDKC